MTQVRRYIVRVALKLLGVPYIWGGSSPSSGFDCSGFVIWILQIFDLLPSGDWTAKGLSKMWPKATAPLPGDLAFYGRDAENVTHVMMHFGKSDLGELVIGASGGGSQTISRELAELANAKVKIKPVNYRRDYLFSVDLGV